MDRAEIVTDTNREDGLLLVEAIETSVEAETGQCIRLFVVTAEKNVKYLLDRQAANLFIATTVLRKWEAQDRIHRGQTDPILDLRVLIKIKISLMP